MATEPTRISKSPWIAYVALAVFILGLAVYLRAATLPFESLTGDELFSVRAASANWTGTWDAARLDLVHPPLYYLLLKAGMVNGDWSSPVAIRALSLIAGIATIAVIIWLGFLVPALRLPCYLAALLVSLNQIHILFSQEARSYAVYSLLVSLLLPWRAAAERYREKRWFWPAGTILMATILWTHYVGAFFCAACIVSMIFVKDSPRETKRASIWPPILSLAAAGALFLPWVIAEIAVYQQKRGLSANLAWMGLPTLFDLKMVFGDMIGIFNFPGATTVACLLGLVLICGAFLPRAGTSQTLSSGMRSTLLLMAVGPPIILWLLTRWPFQLPVFGGRHLLPATIPALILICYGLTRIAAQASGSLQYAVLGAGTIVLCLFQVAPVVRDWPGPYRTPYSVIAADIARLDPAAPIYTTHFYGAGQAVSFYRKGAQRVLELPELAEQKQLPSRLLVLYRPWIPEEAQKVKQLLDRFQIISDRPYASKRGTTFPTHLAVLSKK